MLSSTHRYPLRSKRKRCTDDEQSFETIVQTYHLDLTLDDVASLDAPDMADVVTRVTDASHRRALQDICDRMRCRHKHNKMQCTDDEQDKVTVKSKRKKQQQEQERPELCIVINRQQPMEVSSGDGPYCTAYMRDTQLLLDGNPWSNQSGKPGKLHEFNEEQNKTRLPKKVRFLVVDDSSGCTTVTEPGQKAIHLSRKMTDNLQKYWSSSDKWQSNGNCHGFAHLLKGWFGQPVASDQGFALNMSNQWMQLYMTDLRSRMREIRKPTNLRLGDYVLLVDEHDNLLHSLIWLGRGLSLCKFGGLPIGVATMQDLSKIYPHRKMFKLLLPRRRRSKAAVVS